MNFTYSFARVVLTPFVKFFYPTKIIHKERYPKGQKNILISNHLRWVDVLLMTIYFPEYRHIIGKKELSKNAFFRWGAKKTEMVLIDRNKADMASVRQVVEYLKKGENVGMFPEGTRNKISNELQQAKGGVVMFSLKGDAQIVPAIIYKKSKIFRKNYIYVDEPFKLTSLEGKILSTKILDEGIKIVTEKMENARAALIEYVENKQWKADKKINKQLKKDSKKQKRLTEKLGNKVLEDVKQINSDETKGNEILISNEILSDTNKNTEQSEQQI